MKSLSRHMPLTCDVLRCSPIIKSAILCHNRRTDFGEEPKLQEPHGIPKPKKERRGSAAKFPSLTLGWISREFLHWGTLFAGATLGTELFLSAETATR
ncbi:hypothetical protein AGOR_G00190900 [Albula goreensis]|uniref:Uncharacterized protein n=1 Tax=Albula goreensis TaxID=1534307 RepID=A0A8T3CW22_9TELE|nr:hypothetical protein AGOR_G00190900 [Albula goreensis]